MAHLLQSLEKGASLPEGQPPGRTALCSAPGCPPDKGLEVVRPAGVLTGGGDRRGMRTAPGRTYRPTPAEVAEYAQWLGIDAGAEAELLWAHAAAVSSPRPLWGGRTAHLRGH